MNGAPSRGQADKHLTITAVDAMANMGREHLGRNYRTYLMCDVCLVQIMIYAFVI
jgi:hypothetical protein